MTMAAVSNFATRKSWGPDGAPQKTWVVPDTLKQIYNGPPSNELKTVSNFVTQITTKDLTAMPSVLFKVGDQTLGLAYTLRDQYKQGLWWSGAGKDNRKLPATVDVKVGIGVGAWKATSSHNLQSGEAKGSRFFGNLVRNMKYPGMRETLVVLDGTVPKSVAGKMAYRIKLYDVNGVSLRPAGIGPLKAGVPSRWFFVENGKRLVRVDLVTQPYKWLTFKGVHTKAR